MPVKHAVLGLVLERRGYGYELVQRLRARVGPAWQLSPSAVYSALDSLEADGLVAGAIRVPASPPTRVPRRHGRVVYEVTEAGTTAFRSWMRTREAALEPIRSELLLKIAVADATSIPVLIEAIEHEERLSRRLIAESREAAQDGAAKLVTAATLTQLRGHLWWLAAAREALHARETV